MSAVMLKEMETPSGLSMQPPVPNQWLKKSSGPAGVVVIVMPVLGSQ